MLQPLKIQSCDLSAGSAFVEAHSLNFAGSSGHLCQIASSARAAVPAVQAATRLPEHHGHAVA